MNRLSIQILAGLVIGLVAGVAAQKTLSPFWAEKTLWVASFIGEAFLRAIFMLILPLVIPAILLSIKQLQDIPQAGKIARYTLFSIVSLTSMAAIIGLLLTHLIRPGDGVPTPTDGLTAPPSRSVEEIFLHLIPKNPFAEIASLFSPLPGEGGLLAVLVFVIFLGVALTHVPHTQTLYNILQNLYDASLWLIQKILLFTPVGVAGLAYKLAAQTGLPLFFALGKYIFTVLLGLAIQWLVTYSIFLRFFAKTNPLTFLRQVSPAFMMAFSTSSSSATLPTSLLTAQKIRIPKPIADFILPLGATVNQNGTALYEGVTLLFLAQVYGVELGVHQQILAILMAMFIAIGAAGVPGGSLPLLAGILPFLGIPPQAIGIILGIDRLLDMSRTMLNVYGDLVIARYLSQRLTFVTHGDPSNSPGSS